MTRNVLISGASGLIGGALSQFAIKQGDNVLSLVRDPAAAKGSALYWNPADGTIDAASLEGLDVVVHLAGASVFSGRWTQAKKSRIRDSRVKGTRLLATCLSRLARPPSVLVSASAIGYYGSQGDRFLDEESEPGRGFLAEVCRDWESATQPAIDAGIRVVHLRIGLVLSRDGGALAQMLRPFRLGLGSRLGSGDQWMSWIAIEDLLGAVDFVSRNVTLSGPVNAVAPEPVTNAVFTETLGHVLNRPTFLHAPAAALKTVFGTEAARELLLSSARVVPRRLEHAGFKWTHPRLEDALRAQLQSAQRAA